MKIISPVEVKFVNQFQNMVKAFEIENNVKFESVQLVYNADGSIGYLIEQQAVPVEPEPEE